MKCKTCGEPLLREEQWRGECHRCWRLVVARFTNLVTRGVPWDYDWPASSMAGLPAWVRRRLRLG